MSGKLGKPCREPRCPEIVTGKEKYCKQHQSLEEPYRFNYCRKPKLKLYHTAAWKKLRAWKLAQDPVCEKCKRVPARVVHYLKQAREWPELQLEPSNLMSLCDQCHNQASGSETFVR